MWDFFVAHVFETVWTVLLGVAAAYIRSLSVSQAATAVAQGDATANAAIQAAVANFAGTVKAELENKGRFVESLLDTNILGRLQNYVEGTVRESLDRLKVTPETLATMLSGKLRN